MDNTGSTNKHAFFMGWGMEMVQHGVIEYLRFSFLVAGHTKFDVDRVFSVTAKAYSTADIFNTQELVDFMCQSDTITAILINGTFISNWREKLVQKYSKLPGIRELHDFLIVRNPSTKYAMMLTRDYCHGGAAKPTTMKLNSNFTSDLNGFCATDETYIELGKIRTLQSTKL